jgi:hypothetical protein
VQAEREDQRDEVRDERGSQSIDERSPGRLDGLTRANRSEGLSVHRLPPSASRSIPII